MGDFKAFDGGEPFLEPERPFLLIYTDPHDGDSVSYSFFDSEDDLIEVTKEVKLNGFDIQLAVEIGIWRDINVD